MRAVIILAGGRSSRFGRDKALLTLTDIPLIAHIVQRLRGLCDECVVSVGRNHVVGDFARILPDDTLVIQDTVNFEGPLAGFITALDQCKSSVCFLGACDMPFIEPKVVEYLFQACAKSSGAVPKWRDGRLEPLHAVYDCVSARQAAQQVIDEESKSMVSLVDHMPQVRFVSVEEEISPLDPTLNTFRNLNTPRDLEMLEKKTHSGSGYS